jgi:hypothetical protein
VETAPVGKPGLDIGLGLVDAQPQRADDSLDQMVDLGVRFQLHPCALDPAGKLDIDIARPVDHDLGDAGIAKQRLERTEADHLIRDLSNQLRHLGPRDDDPVLLENAAHGVAQVEAAVGLRTLEEGGIPLLQQPFANVLFEPRRAVGVGHRQLPFGACARSIPVAPFGRPDLRRTVDGGSGVDQVGLLKVAQPLGKGREKPAASRT